MNSFGFIREIIEPYLIIFISFQGKKIQRMVDFDPPIYAYDQDKGINASLEYSILQGEFIFLITTIQQYL